MQRAGILVATLLAVAVMAACTDIPTEPRGPRLSPVGQGLSRDYILDPVVVVGTPKCDPWLDLNWCQGEDGGATCMSSVPGQSSESDPGAPTNTCPGFGGGGSESGGGWSGGNTGGGANSGGDSDPPATGEDLIDQDSLPNCANSASWTVDWHAPYCNGAAPTGSTLNAFESELSAMEARGPWCAQLAQFGRTLLSQGRVRYFTGSGPTIRSWGGANAGIIIDTRFVSKSPPYDHGFVLAHELEHAATGYRHSASDLDSNGVNRTPNDGTCG